MLISRMARVPSEFDFDLLFCPRLPPCPTGTGRHSNGHRSRRYPNWNNDGICFKKVLLKLFIKITHDNIS